MVTNHSGLMTLLRGSLVTGHKPTTYEINKLNQMLLYMVICQKLPPLPVFCCVSFRKPLAHMPTSIFITWMNNILTHSHLFPLPALFSLLRFLRHIYLH